MKSERVFLWELLYLVYKEFSVTKLTFWGNKMHFGLQHFAVCIQWKFV